MVVDMDPISLLAPAERNVDSYGQAILTQLRWSEMSPSASTLQSDRWHMPLLRSYQSLLGRGSYKHLVPMRLVRAVAALCLLTVGTAHVWAQEPTPSPSPTSADQNLKIPPVAPEYRAKQSPLPELGRVGVDMDQQQPLSLREALKMALENNKDIEVARENVKLAEFDLLGAHGAYDPRLSSQSYYERVKTPTTSFLSGGANGAVTTSDYT